MSQLKNCLYGPMQQKPKKNFLKENVKQLRSMQKVIQEKSKKPEEKIKRGFNAVQITKVNGVRKANVYLASSESSTTIESSESGSETKEAPTVSSAGMKTSHQLSKAVKHQAVQTVERMSEIDEGIVRYPSRQQRGAGEELTCTSQLPVSSTTSRRENNRGDSQCDYVISQSETDQNKTGTSPQKPVDYVKQNATIQIKEKVPQVKLDPTKPPPNYRKGVVPKYLLGMRKETGKSEVETNNDGNECAGHVRISDHDRLEHLRIIRQQYADLIQQLNNLPVRNDSFKVRNRKIEIEKELDKLEKGIKLFSMEKLYVKVL